MCIDLHIPRDAADGYFSSADRTDRASVIGFYEKLPVVVYPDRSAGKGFLWIKYMDCSALVHKSLFVGLRSPEKSPVCAKT